MFVLVTTFAAIVATTAALPNPLNVVTVPPNCPGGLEWINNQCRVIWRQSVRPISLTPIQLYSDEHAGYGDVQFVNDVQVKNNVAVPRNCETGNQLVNGACRDIWKSIFSPRNVVTVPPNCPPGQEYINGQCREVWRNTNNDVQVKNNVAVPRNCETGNQLVNGACRDIWKSIFSPRNVVTVPPNCPPGQEYINGQCREVWRNTNNDVQVKNNVAVPRNCETGNQLVNGACRDIWKSIFSPRNVVTVPPNCPPGQEYINGQCREVWRNTKEAKLFETLLRTLKSLEESSSLSENEIEGNTSQIFQSKRITGVPYQCPRGYKLDAKKFCRRIFHLEPY